MVQTVTVIAGVAAVDGTPMGYRIDRRAADTGDTLANDIAICSIGLHKGS